MSADSSCIINYSEKLAPKIASLQLTMDQIYNCDKNQSLLQSSNNYNTSGSEISTPGFKVRKHRLTILLCSNVRDVTSYPSSCW